MISEELARNIALLKEIVWGSKDSPEKVAEFFRKAASEGEDLSPVIPELIQTFLEHRSISSMVPIAEALVLHHLNKKEFGKLRELLQRKAFGPYLLTSIRELAGRGKDIAGFIGDLIEVFGSTEDPGSKRDLMGALTSYAKRARARLSNVVQIMAHNRFAAEILPEFLKNCLIGKKKDLSEFLPTLFGLLAHADADDKQKSGIANAILNIVGKEISLQPFISEMENFLTDKTVDVRKVISFCLGSWHVKNSHFDECDKLISHSDPEIRIGMISAINSAIYDELIIHHDFIARLAGFLLDPDERIRTFAEGGLENANQKEVDICVDSRTLALLVANLGNPTLATNILPYLFAVSVKQEKQAKLLLKVISEAKMDQNDPTIRKLWKTCQEKIEGKLEESCTLCRNLPREKVYTAEYEVPKEAERLEKISYGNLRKCPSCGMYYQHFCYHEQEPMMDGGGSTTEITLRRISPPEALTLLKGNDLDSYRKNYAKIISDCQNRLDHFQTWVQENAAWDLFHHYSAENQSEKVVELLEHSDSIIQILVSEALTQKIIQNSLSPVPFIPALRRGLTNHESKVRSNCARALGRYYMAESRFAEIHELLAIEDFFVKQMILLNIFEGEVHRKMDISPFFPMLRKLVSHDDATVRKYAGWALQHAPSAEAAETIDTLLKALESHDDGTRCNALWVLGRMVEAGNDLTIGIPLVANLLLDHNKFESLSISYLAQSVLKAAVARGMDISPAFSNLLEILKQKGDDNCGEKTQGLLLKMEGVDFARAVPVFSEMLSRDKHSKNWALEALQQLAEKKGIDLSDAEIHLGELLLDDTDYDRRRALYALTWHYLNQKKWKEIEKFLKHPRRDIRDNSTFIVRESARNGADISPLLPFLEKM